MEKLLSELVVLECWAASWYLAADQKARAENCVKRIEEYLVERAKWWKRAPELRP